MFRSFVLFVMLAVLPGLSFAIDLPLRVTSIDRSVTLSWSAPTAREDGTALTASEIGGYEIALAVDASPPDIIQIAAFETSHELNSLTPGVYEFAINAFDTDGLYSQWSDPVTATVRSGVGPEKPQLSFIQRVAAWFTSRFGLGV